MTGKVTTVLKAGTLIDGTGRAPLKDVLILIEGSKIAAIGEEKDVKIQTAATVIEAGDKTVMPGLMDMHVHLGNVMRDPRETNVPEATAKAPEGLKVLYTAKHAEDCLKAGFTTLRDPGGWDVEIGVIRAIEHGLVNGPRIIAAKSVTHARTAGEGGVAKAGTEVIEQGADGPWQVRARVRDIILHDQADFIKTHTSGSVASLVSHLRIRAYTLEEMTAIVDETHAYGKRVAVHAYTAPAVKIAVEAGADTIEHGAFISDDKDLIDMMVRKGTFWVPTMIVYTDRGLLNPAHTWMPPFRREKAAEVNRNMEKNFRILHKAGVKIVMGTDTARNNVHGDNAGELEIYVKCGMTPMEAIVASTKMGAQALGYPWSEQLGTVEQGKEADLLVIDGDPLKDIAILQNKDKIRKVVKGGKVVIDREL